MPTPNQNMMHQTDTQRPLRAFAPRSEEEVSQQLARIEKAVAGLALTVGQLRSAMEAAGNSMLIVGHSAERAYRHLQAKTRE